MIDDKLIDKLACFMCGCKVEWYQDFVMYNKDCFGCSYISKIPFLQTEQEHKEHEEKYRNFLEYSLE